jgi:sporulation protein YlmC with PRC-barrel domain
MKHKLKFIISASAASVLACSALAQDNPPPNTDRPDYTHDRMAHPRAERLNSAAKASDVIGMTVKNYQDEKLGAVEDLAVDLESGRIVQVIISTGGFLGVGDRLTAVPPGALHHDVANKVLHLDANKEKLKSAPEFKTAKWAECCDMEHLSSVYTYYGQEPAFKFIHKSDAIGNTTSTRNADGAWTRDRLTGENQWMIPASRLGQIQKASKLMGLTVKNRQDEKLGTVDNMLVDVQSGRIVAVVVSSGGFLGMGDELSAVPPTALRFNTERDTLQLDTTKDTLSAAPHFKANQWPDFAQPIYADGVYRAYKVEPYFTTNVTTEADNARRNVRDRDDRTATREPDNTARNVRDRNDRTLTPLDQGNSKADVDTTAQIRKGIIADKTMSVNARNVKVITNKGQVTLRGPVNTAEEKRLIGDIATKIATLENVDNQLEVK